VLTSFAAYLAWTTTLESLVAFYGYEAVRPYSAGINPLVGLFVLWLTYIAWRPESQKARAYVATLRRLRVRATSGG
jgi:purine-cytosine permease-like protein